MTTTIPAEPVRTGSTSTVLKTQRHPLDSIFAPRSVAVVGASDTPGSVGNAIMRNLVTGDFHGTIHPVNPKRATILGRKAVASVADLDRKIDLAVIAAPAAAVPGIVGECADAGVGGAIIISAGFKECGERGAELERQILDRARGRLRLIGPNCLGVMNPHTGLNATFAAAIARPGNVGFISQSGALCTAILDWSFKEHVGFSAFVSIGSMLDVGWGDLIDYLGDDPHTRSIVLYMESIGDDARAFLSAAREVAMTKPIIVIKVGRSEAASKAAASHTGALTGSDEVLDAVFRRVGALRVDTISELFDMVDVLSRQPRPAGPRLTIVTNAGGPGVLATDMLITRGGELAPLPDGVMSQLNELLPPHWSRNNPIDVLGDANADRYVRAVEIASENPNSDGMLVILTPQAMTDPNETATKLAPLAHRGSKPILASWMGGGTVAEAERILNDAGIPSYEYPDAAARAFCYMWKYSENLDALYETPALPVEERIDQAAAAQTIASARRAGRALLTELESKQLLAAYGIPTVPTHLASSAAEAMQLADAIGYPVVIKLHSETITHKTDVGGVRLNLCDRDAVRAAFLQIRDNVAAKAGVQHFRGVTVQPMIRLTDAYELILGSSIDPQFGPILLFGSGGQLVEVFKDRSLGLPPLNITLARRMIERTRIHRALRGVRGRKAVDLGALEQLLVRFSSLVIEQPWIREIDINPLLASSDRLIALDARVVLHDPSLDEAQLPRPPIRPYPAQYVSRWTSKSGMSVLIRPLRPEDEPMMVEFHRTLSDRAVHQRYFGTLRLEERIAHQRLRRICFNDFDREMALVAERTDVETGRKQVIAVGRLSKLHGVNDAEFAIVVGNPWQGQGIGTELLRRLVQIGRDEKLTRIIARILPDNREMIAVCGKLDFVVGYDEAENVCTAELAL